MKKKEVKRIAKLISNVNRNYWKAIVLAGELEEELDNVDEETLYEVAKEYKKIDESIIFPEDYGARMQKIDNFAKEFQNILDQIED